MDILEGEGQRRDGWTVANMKCVIKRVSVEVTYGSVVVMHVGYFRNVCLPNTCLFSVVVVVA